MVYAKSEATVAAILAAARPLFLAQNYADVTMDSIAEAAGVTKGALYHHFANKEALYLAMLLADLRDKQALFAAAARSPGTSRDRLRRLVAAFLSLPREQREAIKLVRRDINSFKDPVRRQLVRAYQAALPEQAELIVRDGIRAGEIRPADPRLLAWLHVAMVEVILTRYAASVLAGPSEAVDFIVDLFFRGAGFAAAPLPAEEGTHPNGQNVH